MEHSWGEGTEYIGVLEIDGYDITKKSTGNYVMVALRKDPDCNKLLGDSLRYKRSLDSVYFGKFFSDKDFKQIVIQTKEKMDDVYIVTPANSVAEAQHILDEGEFRDLATFL